MKLKHLLKVVEESQIIVLADENNDTIGYFGKYTDPHGHMMPSGYGLESNIAEVYATTYGNIPAIRISLSK